MSGRRVAQLSSARPYGEACASVIPGSRGRRPPDLSSVSVWSPARTDVASQRHVPTTLCHPRDGLGRSQAHGVEECQRGTVQETSYALTPVEPADEHTPQHLRMGGPFGRERPLWISRGSTNFGRILHIAHSRISLLEATLRQRKDQAGERSFRINELWR